MAGDDGRDQWHPRRGAVPVTWFLHDEHGDAYAAMQRLEDEDTGAHAFEVRAADGRELGVHATGDAAWADYLSRRVDEDDEEPDQPF
jgi:hypothetical protein